MLCIVDLHSLCQGDSLRRDQAHRGAVPLYESLKSQFQMVAFSQEHEEIANWWMKKERLPDWALLKVWEPEIWQSYEEWVVHQIGGFLAEGWEIAAYVDSNADRIRAVREIHVTTMLLSYPERGPGFYDPDKAPRAWAEVSATVGESLGGDRGPG